MGKFKRKIVPTAEGIKRRQEQEQEAARQKQIAETERVQAHMKERKEKRIAGIVFFSASVFLFVLATVFFAIDLFRMHAYETEYTRVTGTVIDIELHRIGMERNYYLVISYSFGGSDYILHDTDPVAGSRFDLIGTKTELFVLPSNPILAITVSTSGRSSVIGAVLFAIGAFAFTIATRFLFGSYKKRLLCAYLPLFLAAIAYLCLFVVAFPNGGLGAVFARMDGAVGYAVAAGYALAAASIDGILSKIIKKYSV